MHNHFKKKTRRRTDVISAILLIICWCNIERVDGLATLPVHRHRLYCAKPKRSSFQRYRGYIVRANSDENDENGSADATTRKRKTQPTLAPIISTPEPLKLKIKVKKVRLRVFSTLNLPIVEVASTLAVLLSSLLVALSTLQDLPPSTYLVMDDALLALNIIFFLDFFVRWYAAGQFKTIYLTKPFVVLDIIVVIIPLLTSSAVVPFLQFVLPHDIDLGGGTTLITFLVGLQNSAGLQNLLLLRVLRLRRVLTDMNTFGKFEVALGLKPQDVRPYQLQLARVLLSIFTLLSVASGLIYTAEHDVNPDIPDYFSALYFGLTTLTTVGFGGKLYNSIISCNSNHTIHNANTNIKYHITRHETTETS